MDMELQKARELVIEAGKKLVETGLIARTWGNVSCRVNDKQFVITPSGRAYETLTPEEIVLVNIEDCSYDGDIKPSSEKESTLSAISCAQTSTLLFIHTSSMHPLSVQLV